MSRQVDEVSPDRGNPTSRGPRLMGAYLAKTPPRNRETGGRKYFTEGIIDRLQRMGATGQSQFSLDELVSFNPRFDSPPYPVSDMLVLEPPSAPALASSDLGFPLGGRTYSAPILFGEYSFGATQQEVHQAVAEAAKMNDFIFGVGEGGVAPPIIGNPNIMVQVATGLFGVNPDMLRQACVVSIKMSQSAKIGMGGHLPKAKVTETIRRIRGMPGGVDILSDASRVFSIEEMRALVQAVKHVTGKPVLVKAGASHSIEHVAAGAARAGADGIIIDGRGGGTGAAPNVHRDHIGMEIELAVRLAHRQIERIGMREKFRIIAAGRVDLPSKAFKLMLLGADGVLLGTASLVGLGCKVVNMCHKDCPTALTAIPTMEGGWRKRELDLAWATDALDRFFRAYRMELGDCLRTFGFATASDAVGHSELLHAEKMPRELASMLGVPSSAPAYPAPAKSPQKYYSDLLESLAKTGKPSVSSMGRTTDLDAPYSNLDLLDHEGRTVVGPAYDSHREVIETMVRLPGSVNISMPLILEDGNGEETTKLAREKNTIILCSSTAEDPKRRIIPVGAAEIPAKIYHIRESSGVLLSVADATRENIREIKMLSPSTPVYASIEASESIREDSVSLARAGVDGLIIAGAMGMAGKIPLDVAVSQADDALSLAIHDGMILRRKTVLIARAAIRSSRDIYALACLGADAVVCDPSKLITEPTYQRQLNLLSGLAAELRQHMGASGLSMISSVTGNRNILRASHYLDARTASLLGVDYIGA
ncbi:MAG TPA: glutamate synthase-related protein [Candidatus Bilamarchaeum sp.]|nr:glutamate synthase-related protein [Candidatus Bilamarchaeum sp.]